MLVKERIPFSQHQLLEGRKSKYFPRRERKGGKGEGDWELAGFLTIVDGDSCFFILAGKKL